MTDPKRWIESEDDSFELERRVLREELHRSPPAGLEDAGWAALAANIAAQAAATSTAATSSSSAGSALAGGTSAGSASGVASGVLTALKAAAVGAALGAAVLSGAEVLRPTASTPAPSVPASAASASVSALPRHRVSTVPSAARPVGSTEVPAGSTPAKGPSAVATTDSRERARPSSSATPSEVRALEPPVSAPASRAAASVSFPDLGPAATEASSLAKVGRVGSAQSDQLKQEALELASAKNLLHAGRASEAYAALVRSAQRFPVGALSEERELLLVEALSALGKLQVARDRAQRFLNTHPHSAITVRMRRFVDGK